LGWDTLSPRVRIILSNPRARVVLERSAARSCRTTRACRRQFQLVSPVKFSGRRSATRCLRQIWAILTWQLMSGPCSRLVR